MIDFLLGYPHSSLEIKNFLSQIFDCSIERIEVFDIDEFNSLTEELDDFALDCVCVCIPVKGDASQMLQVYKYKLADSVVVGRII
ncbi:hypothetical protein RBA41_22485 [Massilia sp. CCM 9210]|uniref:hypothetical protein n=1 Tax=Massilia scottii TaxID=3057166 RepID=UPI0027969D0A|nr:hypothetical protein [Massilia sp. CCM 9210]MDQ1816069.1 hypothetical protein [Massilia sp. CCM 9210]